MSMRVQQAQSPRQGKSCNAISLATDDDTVTIASLSDLEEENLALVTRINPSWTIVTGTVQKLRVTKLAEKLSFILT